MTDNQPQDQEWVTEPLQARSQETLNRFLDAAEQLLREQPFDDVTVAEIVRRAERTVGSFYARFSDKDALIRTLAQRVIDELVADLQRLFSDGRWMSKSLVDIVSEAVAASTTVLRRNAHVARAALVLASRDDDARASRWKNYHSTGEAVVTLMRHAVPDDEMPAAEDIRNAIEVVAAVLDTRLLFSASWQPGGAVDLEAEIQQITDIALRVLNLR